MRQLRCFRSLLCSEPGDAERVHVISLGALQFLLSEAPSAYWVEQRNSEAVCRERGEQVPPVVTGRLHRHQTVSWIAENISKPPIPVSVLCDRPGSLYRIPVLVDYRDRVMFRAYIDSREPHPPTPPEFCRRSSDRLLVLMLVHARTCGHASGYRSSFANIGRGAPISGSRTFASPKRAATPPDIVPLHRNTAVEKIQDTGEMVVLAGDIGVGLKGVRWAVGEAERLQKDAVYVPGNHEYYGERLNVLETMRAVVRGSRVHVLDMDEFRWDGVRFLGVTLWTDYLAFGREQRPAAMDKAARFLNHRRLTHCPYGILPKDALARHERAKAWLERKLADQGNGATIVVTHHAPSLAGTDARFHKDHLTAAFVSDLEDLIRTYSPTLWIHGHTHHCVRYVVGRTPVAANQKGYPHEPATGLFDPCLVVDV